MKTFIDAIKTRDLTLIEKEFTKIMEAKKEKLLGEQKVAIASSIVIEGEEPTDEPDEDEDEDDEPEDHE